MSKIISWLKQSFKVLSLLISLILLTACSVFGGDNDKKNIVTQLIPLLPVPEALTNRIWLEKFTFVFDGPLGIPNKDKVGGYAKQSMLLQTELNAQSINIAAISFDGIPLAQASWQAGSQKVKSELTVAKNFDAKQVLHDLQIVNWPIKLIASSLAENFSVEEQIVSDKSNGDKIRTRRFYHHGEVIIIIHYQAKTINFEQLSAGYRLGITRLTDSALTATLAPKNK